MFAAFLDAYYAFSCAFLRRLMLIIIFAFHYLMMPPCFLSFRCHFDAFTLLRRCFFHFFCFSAAMMPSDADAFAVFALLWCRLFFFLMPLLPDITPRRWYITFRWADAFADASLFFHISFSSFLHASPLYAAIVISMLSAIFRWLRFLTLMLIFFDIFADAFHWLRCHYCCCATWCRCRFASPMPLLMISRCFWWCCSVSFDAAFKITLMPFHFMLCWLLLLSFSFFSPLLRHWCLMPLPWCWCRDFRHSPMPFSFRCYGMPPCRCFIDAADYWCWCFEQSHYDAWYCFRHWCRRFIDAIEPLMPPFRCRFFFIICAPRDIDMPFLFDAMIFFVIFFFLFSSYDITPCYAIADIIIITDYYASIIWCWLFHYAAIFFAILHFFLFSIAPISLVFSILPFSSSTRCAIFFWCWCFSPFLLLRHYWCRHFFITAAAIRLPLAHWHYYYFHLSSFHDYVCHYWLRHFSFDISFAAFRHFLDIIDFHVIIFDADYFSFFIFFFFHFRHYFFSFSFHFRFHWYYYHYAIFTPLFSPRYIQVIDYFRFHWLFHWCHCCFRFRRYCFLLMLISLDAIRHLSMPPLIDYADTLISLFHTFIITLHFHFRSLRHFHFSLLFSSFSLDISWYDYFFISLHWCHFHWFSLFYCAFRCWYASSLIDDFAYASSSFSILPLSPSPLSSRYAAIDIICFLIASSFRFRAFAIFRHFRLFLRDTPLLMRCCAYCHMLSLMFRRWFAAMPPRHISPFSAAASSLSLIIIDIAAMIFLSLIACCYSDIITLHYIRYVISFAFAILLRLHAAGAILSFSPLMLLYAIRDAARYAIIIADAYFTPCRCCYALPAEAIDIFDAAWRLFLCALRFIIITPLFDAFFHYAFIIFAITPSPFLSSPSLSAIDAIIFSPFSLLLFITLLLIDYFISPLLHYFHYDYFRHYFSFHYFIPHLLLIWLFRCWCRYAMPFYWYCWCFRASLTLMPLMLMIFITLIFLFSSLSFSPLFSWCYCFHWLYATLSSFHYFRAIFAAFAIIADYFAALMPLSRWHYWCLFRFPSPLMPCWCRWFIDTLSPPPDIADYADYRLTFRCHFFFSLFRIIRLFTPPRFLRRCHCFRHYFSFSFCFVLMPFRCLMPLIIDAADYVTPHAYAIAAICRRLLCCCFADTISIISFSLSLSLIIAFICFRRCCYADAGCFCCLLSLYFRDYYFIFAVAIIAYLSAIFIFAGCLSFSPFSFTKKMPLPSSTFTPMPLIIIDASLFRLRFSPLFAITFAFFFFDDYYAIDDARHAPIIII